jgi:hypothetical protein
MPNAVGALFELADWSLIRKRVALPISLFRLEVIRVPCSGASPDSTNVIGAAAVNAVFSWTDPLAETWFEPTTPRPFAVMGKLGLVAPPAGALAATGAALAVPVDAVWLLEPCPHPA